MRNNSRKKNKKVRKEEKENSLVPRGFAFDGHRARPDRHLAEAPRGRVARQIEVVLEIAPPVRLTFPRYQTALQHVIYNGKPGGSVLERFAARDSAQRDRHV